MFMMVVMMFIGGNTFSTAGGIKTSTFALICINTYSIIRGKKNSRGIWVEPSPTDDLLKAFTVLVTFGGGMLIACTYLLTLTETPHFGAARPELHGPSCLKRSALFRPAAIARESLELMSPQQAK